MKPNSNHFSHRSLSFPLDALFQRVDIAHSVPTFGTQESDPDFDSDTAIAEKVRIAEPKRWAVLLLNDDYSTMEFVIEVLKKFFAKGDEEAARIMWSVHHHGRGVAGVYSFEIAETKVLQVESYARSKGHPLKCDMEEVSE